jgi:hypothetical protein
MAGRGVGRPPTLESELAECAVELQALTQEAIRNELERARLSRHIASLAERMHRGRPLAVAS